jgi:N-acetylneuraminate synthase
MLPFFGKLVEPKKEIIISTGMATLEEVETSLAIINHGRMNSFQPKSISELRKNFDAEKLSKNMKENVSLLHCTSQYPTQIENVNLQAMETLKNHFGLNIGYSDHTKGRLISIAAVSRGATIIEKHLTLDKKMMGPDHIASAEPKDFKKMVVDIRDLERAMGDGKINCSDPEKDTINKVRKKLIASRNIKKDELFTENNITSLRNDYGVSAIYFWDFIGTASLQNYKYGEAINYEE